MYAVLDLPLVPTVFYQFCDLVEKLEKLDEDLQEVRKLIALPPSHPAFFYPLSSLLLHFRLLPLSSLPSLSLGTRPSKNRKEGLVNGAGWKCTLRNVRNFINC